MRKKLIKRCCPRDWNIRAYDTEDCQFYCGLYGILVLDLPIDRLGVSFKHRGQNVIFIRDDLRGADRLFVLLHEIAHHWLHPPGIQFFQGYGDAIEREANAVAACAMIPYPVLARFSPADIAEMYGYPDDLIEFRQDIYDIWKI